MISNLSLTHTISYIVSHFSITGHIKVTDPDKKDVMTPLDVAEVQEMTRVESLGDVVANPLTGPDFVIYI